MREHEINPHKKREPKYVGAVKASNDLQRMPEIEREAMRRRKEEAKRK